MVLRCTLRGHVCSSEVKADLLSGSRVFSCASGVRPGVRRLTESSIDKAHTHETVPGTRAQAGSRPGVQPRGRRTRPAIWSHECGEAVLASFPLHLSVFYPVIRAGRSFQLTTASCYVRAVNAVLRRADIRPRFLGITQAPTGAPHCVLPWGYYRVGPDVSRHRARAAVPSSRELNNVKNFLYTLLLCWRSNTGDAGWQQLLL